MLRPPSLPVGASWAAERDTSAIRTHENLSQLCTPTGVSGEGTVTRCEVCWGSEGDGWEGTNV